jgi:hypothetical protein
MRICVEIRVSGSREKRTWWPCQCQNELRDPTCWAIREVERVSSEVLLRQPQEIRPTDFVFSDRVDVFGVEIGLLLIVFKECKYICLLPSRGSFAEESLWNQTGVISASGSRRGVECILVTSGIM